ncbi:MAG: hypothetical protein AB7F75_05040 [Planctomycetota bacterium]
MNPTRVGWFLVLAASTLLRVDMVRMAAWNRDAAAGLWIGLDWMQGGTFPLTGINSSTGAMTPNGVPLLGAALSLLPGGLLTMSLVLSLSQMLAIAWLCTKPRLPEGARLLMAAVILLDPFMVMHSLDIWNLYPTLTLLCLTACCLDMIRTNGSRFWWLASGFCISGLPALYLGNVAAVMALFVLGLSCTCYRILSRGPVAGCPRRAREDAPLRVSTSVLTHRSLPAPPLVITSPPFHPVYAIVLGALPALALSLIPYAAYLEANPESRDLLFNQAHVAQRSADHVQRALTHPFRLLCLPRSHILYGDSRIISEQTEKAVFGSFHAQTGLHLLLLSASILLWILARKKLAPCPFTRTLGLFYVILLGLFLILPSQVFTKVQQGVPYAAFVWILLLAPGLAAAWILGAWPRRIMTLLGSATILSGLWLAHRVTADHLEYKGERISPAGAPLEDLRRASAFLARSESTTVNVDYDFSHGNYAAVENEYRVYIPRNPAGSMAAGRSLDAELLMCHGLRNLNEGLAVRDSGQGDWLVTWSFVSREQLVDPWKSQAGDAADFGRLRVFKAQRQ